ncbi:hypothetical protein NN561_012935 [Cricetulus griseus]
MLVTAAPGPRAGTPAVTLAPALSPQRCHPWPGRRAPPLPRAPSRSRVGSSRAGSPRAASAREPASRPTLHAGPWLPPLLLSEVRLRQGWPIAPDCAERAPPPLGPALDPAPSRTLIGSLLTFPDPRPRGGSCLI